MKKIFLLIPLFAFALMANATIPELTKSAPLTLTATSEGFTSLNTNALDGEWINWNDEFIHQGYAMWRVNIVNSGIYAVTLDMTCDNTSEFLVSVINPLTGDTIDKGKSSHDWAKTDAALSCGLVSLINLEPGEYDIAVTEVVQWSHAKLRGVTIGYLYGERVTPTTTLLPADAVLSQYAQLDKSGTVDSLTFAPKTSEWQAVDAEYSVEGSQYVKWNLKLQGGKYKFTANTYCKQGHNYRIMILNADESSIIYTKQEKEGTGSDYHNEGADWQVATDILDLAKGNYVLKMQGKAYGRVMSVEAEYLGGTIVNLPATLMPEDAIRSQYAQLIHGTVDTLTFARLDHEWEAKDNDYTVAGSQYVKWIMKVDKAGKYKFTANTYCKQGHNYRIILMNEAETDTIVKIQEVAGTGSDYHNEGADWQYGTDAIDLTAGKYVLMMQAKPYGRVMNVVASYEGGAIVNAPGLILAADALIKAETGKTSKMIHQANGDIEYKSNASQLDEYAEWNFHATEAGEMVVTIHATGENGGHEYKLELFEGNTLKGSAIEEADTKWKKVDFDFTNHLTIPAAGDYTLKLTNNVQYSVATLHGITFTPYVAPAGVTMTDTDTDNSAWVANVGGAACNVTLNRTILGGMYNAICLPFALTSSQVKAAFGNDVQLYYLDEATLANEVLDLQFKVTNDIWQGTPYLIKTSSDVANPTFNGVSILLEEASSTYHTGWPVSFKGTFVQTTIAADGQNMLLYANDKIGFPSTTKTLNGFRAYFQLQTSSGAPIREARIITPNNVPTVIDLVDSESTNAQKILRDGQLIILKNGVQYNVQGQVIR